MENKLQKLNRNGKKEKKQTFRKKNEINKEDHKPRGTPSMQMRRENQDII